MSNRYQESTIKAGVPLTVRNYNKCISTIAVPGGSCLNAFVSSTTLPASTFTAKSSACRLRLESVTTSLLRQPTVSHPTMSSTRPNLSVSNVRIVSYNVLSSALASISQFPSCAPEDLDASNRLTRVQQKLRAEAEKGSIICLQEVSRSWTGPLHAFFHSVGYTMIVAPYGRYFNDYMGVAMAFPIDPALKLTNAYLDRVADAKRWPLPPKKEESRIVTVYKSLPVLSRVVNACRKFWQELFWGLSKKSEWIMAKERENVMITAQFQLEGTMFCVGVYHMPCMFYAPTSMAIHCALSVQNIMKRAQGLPFVLTGDFNIKPNDPTYDLMVTGKLPTTFKPVPNPFEPLDKWQLALDLPLVSAYKKFLGSEPQFTNNAQTKDNEPFVETLDYIFCSPSHWDVLDVEKLPTKDDTKTTYPSPDEPSDHLLIAANLRLAQAQA